VQKVAEGVRAATPLGGPSSTAAHRAKQQRPLSNRPRAAQHALAVALARHRDVVAFARALVRGPRSSDRLSRLAAVFSFVGHLVDVPPPAHGQARDGVDLLLGLTGEDEGPALILAALLLALGERASLAYAPGLAFVQVELEYGDLSRLPPHAGPIVTRGRCYLPLDPRRARRPLGLLPLAVRNALQAGL
jgi:hypothetical protein